MRTPACYTTQDEQNPNKVRPDASEASYWRTQKIAKGFGDRSPEDQAEYDARKAEKERLRIIEQEESSARFKWYLQSEELKWEIRLEETYGMKHSIRYWMTHEDWRYDRGHIGGRPY